MSAFVRLRQSSIAIYMGLAARDISSMSWFFRSLAVDRSCAPRRICPRQRYTLSRMRYGLPVALRFPAEPLAVASAVADFLYVKCRIAS